ncbi:hypothetical protein AB4Y43_29615 [Paraburkholderia sp. BR10872]|uniref:hypothetical protein n=1 Tax=Paraburkholderia sp. BR10872 TaxID=3236989 RepID=UPI0034D26F3A
MRAHALAHGEALHCNADGGAELADCECPVQRAYIALDEMFARVCNALPRNGGIDGERRLTEVRPFQLAHIICATEGVEKFRPQIMRVVEQHIVLQVRDRAHRVIGLEQLRAATPNTCSGNSGSLTRPFANGGLPSRTAISTPSDLKNFIVRL